MKNRLQGFISYSTHDKLIAAQVRDALGSLGVDAFLAHDDLNVSVQWRDHILAKLQAMQVFIPLLSRAFKDSDWASQEVGFAIARPDVLIIPLCLDQTVPYGFLGAIQGKWLSGSIDPAVLRDALVSRFPRAVLPHLIEALRGANGWRHAETLFVPLLPYIEQLTADEAAMLAKAATENGQIWDAALCRNVYLPNFLAANAHQLPADLIKPLEYQIQQGEWYRP